MTIIRAKNPSHVRAFDTSKLWWLDDAWDDRTAEWFAADESGRRIEELLQAILRQQPANVPGLLPSIEWLMGLYQRHPHTRVIDFSEDVPRGLSKPFQWMYEVGQAAHWKNGKETTTHQLAQYVVCQVADFTQDDWLEGRFHGGHSILGTVDANITDDRAPLIRELPMLAANPHLPALRFNATRHTKLNPYRWWAQEVVRRQTRYEDGGTRLTKGGSLLSLLLSNVGASHDDLEFVLFEIARVFPEETTAKFRLRASFNPNWEGESLLDIAMPRQRYFLAPTHLPSLPTDTKSVNSVLAGEAEVEYRFDLSEAGWEKLLRGEAGETNEFLREQLAAASDLGALGRRMGGEYHEARRATVAVAHLAPALGYFLREQTEAVGGESVPLEWILELL